ncbi:hypothetical protein C8D92_10358 [Tamilnaduibacter salinus]|uniref:DUF1440 domain-containing protein n=1 Tax=Tamilnaduibacter salinus TaxID=1484056 RepID=A0A2U1CY18_9GAMM|nr:hypothetical protein [Tamilnaduibacter salinus]PVY77373.1 hypothetical protein C8D92_10358 [Tamilnaduibacter salinus]
MTAQSATTSTPTLSWPRTVVVGLITAVIPSLFMVPMFKLGLSPMPAPPSLEFAEMVLGRDLPMPVGLLFHLLYVMLWTIVYVLFLKPGSLKAALGLAGLLWVGVLFVFFPLFGWGLAGTSVSVKLIPASFIPHLLFGLALWGSSRWLMPKD